MNPLSFLVLVAAAQVAPQSSPAQIPPEAAPTKSEGTWRPLNQPALIVNEEIVTMFELQTTVERAARESKPPKTTPPEKQMLLNQVVTERAKEMLRVQAGKDIGFDPEMVQRIVDRVLEEEKEDAGTLSHLGELLAKDEKDRFTREEEVYSYIFGRLWEESVIGKSPSQGGRASHDRYIRPGRLWFEYRDLPTPSVEVQLTQLIITIRKDETPEQARVRTEEFRQRILAGEDMGKLADDFGSTRPNSRGLSDYLPVNKVKPNYPEIYAYLEKAQPGDISEVLPYKVDQTQRGWIVARLEDRRAPVIPPFDDQKYQRGLADDVQRSLDNLRSGLGLEGLLKAAYVWPPDAFGPPPSR
jgi:hypothetical protein